MEVYYPDGDLPANYQKIALCPGSGKSLVNTVIREKAQAFVSGDLSHHDIAKLNLWGITYYHIPSCPRRKASFTRGVSRPEGKSR